MRCSQINYHLIDNHALLLLLGYAGWWSRSRKSARSQCHCECQTSIKSFSENSCMFCITGTNDSYIPVCLSLYYDFKFVGTDRLWGYTSNREEQAAGLESGWQLPECLHRMLISCKSKFFLFCISHTVRIIWHRSEHPLQQQPSRMHAWHNFGVMDCCYLVAMDLSLKEKLLRRNFFSS